jgi:hypothetical protein
MNGAVSFTWVVEMITQCMINTEEVIFLATSTVKKIELAEGDKDSISRRTIISHLH